MIIQCDFDGTIIMNNMSVLIREHFAPDEWREIETEYVEGKLSVEESNRRQYKLINDPKSVIQEFVRSHINVRDGFIEFVKYCTTKKIQFIIVSSGLDLYISAVLNEIGMSDVVFHCAKTGFTFLRQCTIIFSQGNYGHNS